MKERFKKLIRQVYACQSLSELIETRANLQESLNAVDALIIEKRAAEFPESEAHYE